VVTLGAGGAGGGEGGGGVHVCVAWAAVPLSELAQAGAPGALSVAMWGGAPGSPVLLGGEALAAAAAAAAAAEAAAAAAAKAAAEAAAAAARSSWFGGGSRAAAAAAAAAATAAAPPRQPGLAGASAPSLCLALTPVAALGRREGAVVGRLPFSVMCQLGGEQGAATAELERALGIFLMMNEDHPHK
jgi:hypothetical protein